MALRLAERFRYATGKFGGNGTVGLTTPVDVFPSGATLDMGLLHLCGNVWEWTATPWSEGETWEPSMGLTDGAAVGWRVVGGGWMGFYLE